SPSLTAVATTRSPGLRSSARPAAVPITTIAPNGCGVPFSAAFLARVAPMPVWRTRLPGRVRPRRTAFASRRSGARTSRPGFADSGAPSSVRSAAAVRGCGIVSVMQGTPHVSSECGDGERQPVQVVVQVEVAREAGAGEVGLVPGAVRALGLRQPAQATLGRLAVALARREQRKQRRRGLRGGGRAAAGPLRLVIVGAQVLAPAAVVVLHRLQPGDRLAD